MNTRDRDGTEVLTPTEARQASSKTTNFRVLVFSLAALTAIGIALIGAFWVSTPSELTSPAGSAVTAEQPTSTSPTPDANAIDNDTLERRSQKQSRPKIFARPRTAQF
ncbi:MAG: hypothetical protein ACKVP4_08015 [Hyphomicrobium sp.]